MTFFLLRLVVFKLAQLKEIATHRNAESLSKRLQFLLNREEEYITSKELVALRNGYDEALLSYYLFLQNRLLAALEEQKDLASSALIKDRLSVLSYEF